MTKNNKNLFITLALLVISVAAQAKITLPNYFTSNMILQQKSSVMFRGTGRAMHKLTLKTSWDNKTYTTQTGANGQWSIVVPTPKAGTGYDITIDDGEKLTLSNVAVGEVWFCSGQSNMEFPVNGWTHVINFEKELANANHPEIRLFQVKKNTSVAPLSTLNDNLGGWQPCNATTVANFSAIAYFYARALNDALGVPIGVIDATWGGTPVEAWMSYEALKGVKEFPEYTDELAQAGFDQDKVQQLYKQRYSRFFDTDAGVKGNWADVNLKDNDWQTMKLPGTWEKAGVAELNNFDGVAWFRYTVNIPKTLSGKALQLHLAKIDNEDITYFDGTQIGEGYDYAAQRTYTIPANLAAEGRHVITVRAFDTSGDGGIYGEPGDMYISDGREKISLAGDWKYKIGVDLSTLPPAPLPSTSSSYPTVLYNAMVNPLTNFSIAGVIWYQGEANVGRAAQYSKLFPAIIHDWRRQWGKDLPFYFVQLAGFDDRGERQYPYGWAYLREAQAGTLSLHNTGMAVATDIGEANDIHPKNKQEVARRLSLIALANTYGQKVDYKAPIPYYIEVENNTATISFKDGNVFTNNKEALKGFEVAGNDGVFYPAAGIVKGDKITLSSTKVPSPRAVRYNWCDYTEGNLYGTNGLPVAPFRIDK